MLCNSCGKVLEGKATLCPGCKAKGGVWTKTYDGVAHEPDEPVPLQTAEKFGVCSDADKNPTDEAAVSDELPHRPLPLGILILLSLITILLIGLFYHFGQMGGRTEVQSERALVHSALSAAVAPREMSDPVKPSFNDPILRPDPTTSVWSETPSALESGVPEIKDPIDIPSDSVLQKLTDASIAPSHLEPEVVPTIELFPTQMPTVQPTVIPTKPIEIFDNLVRFGAVKRYFPASAAFFNRAQTELRIYLGQNYLDSEKIAALTNHDVRSNAIPLGSDIVFVVEFPNKVEQDCSLSLAKRVSVMMYRTGITGFPIPGRGNSVTLTPTAEFVRDTTLTCSINRDLKTEVAGVLDGSGDFTQGQAAYTLSWKVKLGS